MLRKLARSGARRGEMGGGIPTHRDEIAMNGHPGCRWARDDWAIRGRKGRAVEVILAVSGFFDFAAHAERALLRSE